VKLVITGSKGLMGSHAVEYAKQQKGVEVLGVDVVGMGNRRDYFVTNIGSTWNVFEACARLGIKRVVSASSVQVNRTVTIRTPLEYQYLPLDETHPADPQDDYSASKYLGEQLAGMFSTHYGLTIVSLRFTMVLTPEQMNQICFLKVGQRGSFR
jgi:nucleoside-diphosphate-sugar epimerase